jgi:hypothetical protein
MPPKNTDRAMQIIAVALRNDVESDEVEAACRQHGIDPETADIRQMDRAVKNTYGQPPPTAWLPWRRA